MKKLLFALLLGGLLVLALITVASADNGPHGSFTATTDACAGCHRAHTAQFGSNALLISDPETLCLSCHSGGAGATTNVEDGVYTGSTEGLTGNPLFGGGFVNALMATAWSGAATEIPGLPTSRPTTSTHHVGGSGTVWGSGANNSTNGQMVLECTSCHDPHGTAGWDVSTTPDTRVPSYRLLRWQPQGSGGFTALTTNENWTGGAFPTYVSGTTTGPSGWLVPDNFTTLGQEWYTLGTTGRFAVGDYMAGNTNNVYNVRNGAAAGTATYIPAAVNTAFFCAQCHDRYFNNSRLRNATDASMYCGHPLNGTTPPWTGSPLFLPYLPDVDGVAPYIHPVDPIRCEPVVSTTTGLITGWGDNGDSGDLTYHYRHASGDIRLSSDGATAAGVCFGGPNPNNSACSVSRSCVACHVAHGTAATMTPLASGASRAADSALLRLDNRSMCLRCHASSVNFTVGP